MPKSTQPRYSHGRKILRSSKRQSGTRLRATKSDKCEIVPVGKRRDGGTRYWCLSHKADATAKHGRRAKACRASHIPQISEQQVLKLRIDKHKGGVALWGAVPAVYDTTRLPMDRGIHVHARPSPTAKKEMDYTFRAVRLLSKRLPKEGALISELDAIYYMATSVFGHRMRYLRCSHCGYPHLDRDWFSVHPHCRHLCAGCGKHFRDTTVAVGNPVLGVRIACGINVHKSRSSRKKLKIKQADFPGGIQIWGSNPAFFWTSKRSEEGGIHVHAFRKSTKHPYLDETYGEVIIDGIKLNPLMVRILMAQSALPSLNNRILSIACPYCGNPHFSLGDFAFTPVAQHTCKRCARKFVAPGRLRKTIGNPLLAILARLAERAPRPPQQHQLDLLPETL
jgi:transposase-like protein